MIGEDEDFSAALLAASRGTISVFHEFQLEAGDDQDGVFVFVEGDADKKFYVPNIRQLIGDKKNIYTYICNGKSGVISMRSEIRAEREFDNVCSVFFVDRDFDDYVDVEINKFDKDVFVTDWYSVEGYVVSEESLSVIWEDFCCLQRSILRQAVLPQYNNSVRLFARSVLPISAWIIATRLANQKITLDDIDLNKIFAWTGNWCRRNNFARDELIRVGGGYVPSLKVLIDTARAIRRDDARMFVRGKMLLWFFDGIVKRIMSAFVGVQVTINGKKRRVKIPTQVVSGATFDILSGRLACPGAVQSFLTEHLGG